MSRGFVKEDDQEETPIIPPRAALPANETNYVTPEGKAMLDAERQELIDARAANTDLNDTERRRVNTVIDGKINLLQERINSARVLKPSEQPQEEVRFGATVTFRMNTDGSIKTFKIVGVDEASVKDGKVAFTAPVIRALIGKKKGEKGKLFIGGRDQELEILDIHYNTIKEGRK